MTPQGTYLGLLTECGSDSLNNDNKTPFFYLAFGIEERLNEAGQTEKLDQPIVRDVRFWLTDKAFDGTCKKLQSLGFNGDFANPTMNPAMMIEPVKLDCRHVENGGKTYEEWSIMGMNGDRERKPVTSDAVRRFNAKYKQIAGAFQESPAQQNARAAAHAAIAAQREKMQTANVGAENDVPF